MQPLSVTVNDSSNNSYTYLFCYKRNALRPRFIDCIDNETNFTAVNKSWVRFVGSATVFVFIRDENSIKYGCDYKNVTVESKQVLIIVYC